MHWFNFRISVPKECSKKHEATIKGTWLCNPRFHPTSIDQLFNLETLNVWRTSCWWNKSCTSWYGKCPISYGALYKSGGAGILPSAVSFRISRESCMVHLPTGYCMYLAVPLHGMQPSPPGWHEIFPQNGVFQPSWTDPLFHWNLQSCC